MATTHARRRNVRDLLEQAMLLNARRAAMGRPLDERGHAAIRRIDNSLQTTTGDQVTIETEDLMQIHDLAVSWRRLQWGWFRVLLTVHCLCSWLAALQLALFFPAVFMAAPVMSVWFAAISLLSSGDSIDQWLAIQIGTHYFAVLIPAFFIIRDYQFGATRLWLVALAILIALAWPVIAILMEILDLILSALGQ